MTDILPLEGADFDIVTLVQGDHRTIRALFGRIEGCAPSEREQVWPELLRTLAVHEVAEEMVVFPAVRVITDEHGPALEARIAEQVQAEKLLVQMEDMDPASDEFAGALAILKSSVLEHAAAEEREVLPLIAQNDTALDRPTLGARYVDAQRRAPTHPHPNAPHRPPGNMVVGPVASLFDRIRDHLG